ncbi:MAG: hypothetical protein CVU91_13180 [Firmicutes bacterium HGW-Firmicutes-16]|nr:MAG: hypothetical protein CVU91_13180 [Firmicutes bacterium HGW-Firmicutes-16]
MCFFKHKSKSTAKGEKQEGVSDKETPSWYRSLPGDIYRNWPKTDGEPEAPVFLKHCTSVDMEDEMLISMLSAYSIPAVKIYPGSGSFGAVILGMSGEGSDIFVPVSMHDDAASLIGGSANE